jgi:hypothetical protein
MTRACESSRRVSTGQALVGRLVNLIRIFIVSSFVSQFGFTEAYVSTYYGVRNIVLTPNGDQQN